MEKSNGIIINDIFYSLPDLENDCWLRLLNGSLRSKHAFHTASLATLNGSEISLRTVVLRKVIANDKSLHFNTDTRSMKWKELKANNSISALFYDFSSRIQIRINGTATLHHEDQLADEAWQKTSLGSRRSYLSSISPSSFLEFPSQPFETSTQSESVSQMESEIGRKHFGLVVVKVQTMDWLWLNHAVHHRALFDYSNHQYSWIAP